MKYNKRSLAFKVSAIYLAERRKGSLRETAKDLGVSKSVLGYWIKTKDRLVGEYYASSKDREEGLHIGEGVLIPVWEGAMGRKADEEDLRKQNKAMRERIDYLEDAICYYRHLMEVEGLKPTEAQKKTARRLSEEQRRKEAKGT